MKRVKALQRLWAFLLAFVLIATTVGNDGLTVIAAEANTASEQESEPESTAASENDNTGEETPVLSDNSGNEEKSEVSERMQETSTESVVETFSEEYSDIDTEEETSTTENDPGEETKEAEGTLSEETQSSVWKVSFQKDGDVKILVGETEVKDSFDVEKGKELAFRLEMSEGSGSTVKAGDSELVPSEGIYKFIPDKDVTVTVKAAAIDNVETAEEETTAETESETETRTETETETETESEAETETESETETETETETESETETETEELEETEAEEGTKELFVVTFLVEGKGTITNADGDKIGDQTEVESKKALEFYVNPDEGYEIAEVVIDGTVIARTDNKYAVSPSKDVEVKVTFTEKEEEEEYIETIDTVEVNGVTIKVTTYSAGVLPKGYQVKASELDVSAVEGAVEEKLEAEGKELNQLRAFDITILDKDGKEIQPAGGVRVEIIGTGVEGESVSVFHMENSGSDAEIVAKDRTSGDVSFTASSFSYYIVAGSTEIASYAKSNSYKLYCYTLIPGLQEGVSSNPNQVWNGMGVGSISGVNAPSRYSIGKIITGQGNITYPSSYPDINVSGIAYKYAATGSENAYKEGYYTIEWFRTIVSGGANAGNNGVNPVVPFETNTFHLDGQITLNEKSKYTVTFRVQEPGNSDFTIQSDYSRRVVSGYAERDLNKPPTERKVVNGKEYIFEGWYRDKNCTIKADFNGQITGNTDYYGKYILNEKVFKYTVKHWVDGETCDEDSVLVEVALSEEAAGIKDIELKKYSGYKYERNDKNLQLNKNRTALVGKGTIENDGVINVYYTLNEDAKLNYSVEYYLEGTDAPFDTLKDQSVLVAKPEVKAVADSSNVPAGYTRSTTAPKLPTTITASNNVIKVYYKADENQKLNYSVEYYLEGMDAPFDTLKDQNVLVAEPEVKAVADSSNVPAGYTRSTTAPKLPATITATDNVIKVYYKVDESQKLDYSVEHYLDGETFPFDITTQLSVLVASPEVKNVSDSDTLPAGYTRNRVEPVLPTTITKENKVIKIIYSENEITINYTADTNGSVTNASETIHAVSGKPQGSTATASNGYHFVNWTNEAGEVVSTDAAYVPAKVGGLHVAATYTAHFEADPVAPPTEPTPDEPTGTTPDGPTPAAAPTAATGVLGEAFAPVQPEVGVLGEALAPEVGVLGEAKGPGTGDAAPIAGWSLLIVGAIITLGITARKRKKEEQ